MSDPIPYQPDVLATIGEATDWYDSASLTDGVVVTSEVTGTVTYAIEVSNDERTTRTGIVAASYTTTEVKVLEAPMPRFFRYKKTAGSGSVAIGLGRARIGVVAEVTSSSRHS